MKIIRVFLSENFQLWKVKFSIYLNRRVFIMQQGMAISRKILAHNKKLSCCSILLAYNNIWLSAGKY